jgi:hypothetical protein
MITGSVQLFFFSLTRDRMTTIYDLILAGRTRRGPLTVMDLLDVRASWKISQILPKENICFSEEKF